MQMLFCFINNVHVDYAELLWEGLYYSLTHPTTLIPYPRFTKIIIDHYMTKHLDISRRVHDNYHRVKNNNLVKHIFNSGKNKEGTGMKIPDWMLTDETKLTAHYQMYTAVFWVDVPTTQSQPIESTQGTHKTNSTPRTPNLEITKGESSAQRKSTVIRFHVPRRPDLETPIPTSVVSDITYLDEVIQMSIATQRRIKDYEAQKNVSKVKEHMVDEELDQLLEGVKNVDVDAFMDDVLNSQEDPSTRVETESYKEILEAKKSVDDVTITNDDVEEELARDEFELRRREKGRGIEKIRDTPHPHPLDLI
ncbi:hypothetical protein Tco_1018581 [Tanacetum coccineum]|uniref:Uncharacterized protein n=1 Tax=Tanacetum coccineum TaxID=301880 RepID=A0ABQ5FUN8_9ASTR